MEIGKLTAEECRKLYKLVQLVAIIVCAKL